jgi:diaminopimelate decarboxylase
MVRFWEIESYLKTVEGQLFIDDQSAIDLEQRYGSPLFVFSESRICHNVAHISRARQSIDCPLKICYAAKANSIMGVLGAVKNAGCDIEVNSGGELWKALKAGFTGDQIIFNGTSKEAWEIENAINAGIFAIQVDSLWELSLIGDTAARLSKRANVSLRLVPEIESGTHSGLQTALLTSKFGMMPAEALSAFADHKDSPHIDLCGIHLHVGSQNPEPEVYNEALSTLVATMARIRRETGVELRHVNLGGGFPVDYLAAAGPKVSLSDEERHVLSANFDPAEAITNAWQTARGAAQHNGDEDLLKDLTILVEPGRSIIADAGVCLTTVRNIKQRPLSDSAFPTPHSALDTWLLTDAGFNILLSMETYKWYYHLISASRANEPHDAPYKVAGPLCDGGDVYFDIEGKGRLPDHRFLPENVQPGEVLALLNCGAYTLSQASQYNGRFLPAVVMVRENGEAELIRKRDGFDDLASNEIF